MQVGRLGRGADAVDHQVAEPGLDGADQPGDVPGGAQPGLDQVRGGGLAGRAGDADHGQPRGRVAVDRPTATAPSTARGSVDDQHRQPGRGRRPAAPAGSVSTATAPAAAAAGDELGAVPAGAGQRRVQVAGADRRAGVGHAGDRDVGASAGQLDGAAGRARSREPDAGTVRDADCRARRQTLPGRAGCQRRSSERHAACSSRIDRELRRLGRRSAAPGSAQRERHHLA